MGQADKLEAQPESPSAQTIRLEQALAEQLRQNEQLRALLAQSQQALASSKIPRPISVSCMRMSPICSRVPATRLTKTNTMWLSSSSPAPSKPWARELAPVARSTTLPGSRMACAMPAISPLAIWSSNFMDRSVPS